MVLTQSMIHLLQCKANVRYPPLYSRFEISNRSGSSVYDWSRASLFFTHFWGILVLFRLSSLCICLVRAVNVILRPPRRAISITPPRGALHLRAAGTCDLHRFRFFIARFDFILNLFSLRTRHHHRSPSVSPRAFKKLPSGVSRPPEPPRPAASATVRIFHFNRRTSHSDRKPVVLMPVWCTKISSEPSSGTMNPNPLAALNHFTCALEPPPRRRPRRQSFPRSAIRSGTPRPLRARSRKLRHSRPSSTRSIARYFFNPRASRPPVSHRPSRARHSSVARRSADPPRRARSRVVVARVALSRPRSTARTVGRSLFSVAGRG